MLSSVERVFFKTLKPRNKRAVSYGVGSRKRVIAQFPKPALIRYFRLNSGNLFFFPPKAVLHIVIRHICRYSEHLFLRKAFIYIIGIFHPNMAVSEISGGIKGYFDCGGGGGGPYPVTPAREAMRGGQSLPVPAREGDPNRSDRVARAAATGSGKAGN
jgi:hypothetical protein